MVIIAYSLYLRKRFLVIVHTFPYKSYHIFVAFTLNMHLIPVYQPTQIFHPG